MHARYYAPTMGRFLSVDPIIPTAALREPQRWNRYGYVSNNPMKNADPTGKFLQAVAGPCGTDSHGACYTKLDAFEAVKGFVGEKAAKNLSMGKNGMISITGMSPAAFAKLGAGAAIVANLIRSTDQTAGSC